MVMNTRIYIFGGVAGGTGKRGFVIPAKAGIQGVLSS